MLSSDHIEHLPKEMGQGRRLHSLEPPELGDCGDHGTLSLEGTVNEAEYSGLVKGMQRAINAMAQELVLELPVNNTAAPGGYRLYPTHPLRLLQEAEGLQAKFKSLRLAHVKRDFNAAADYISKRAIQEQSSLEVTDLGERKLLQGLNRIHEKPMKDPSPREQSLVECAFIATARGIPRVGEPGTEGAEEGLEVGPRNPDSQDSKEDFEDARRERWRRICSHQTHDPGLAPLVRFLRGETEQMSLRQTTHLAKMTDLFVMDFRDALFNVSRNNQNTRGTLSIYILHHCHADLQGAHQGITRTYERLRKEFYWIGMFKDTERYVKECVDCVTAKGLLRNPGSSPGNLLATRPFQVVPMDFIIPLPQSARGNRALLLFQ
ncbi:LOW QUALITY PROTEIN: reverse transcriptase [Phytophthora megakarya]|uniref:Reverse transcriptase n=1 Tax=Phytophthora megakarya TaxID=4795 RepID=A0A225VXP5_9STRA|nr:LOW QUALITY PROTEIN: reverse transcriptase [Phytophthora megakarya]